jgi:hypothetical protein
VSEELKPCPWCGNTRVLVHMGKRDAVMCPCGATGPSKLTTSDAKDAWNRRPADAARAALFPELMEALECAVGELGYHTKSDMGEPDHGLIADIKEWKALIQKAKELQ